MRGLLILLIVLLAAVVAAVAVVPAYLSVRVEQAVAASFDRVGTLAADVDLNPLGLIAGRLDGLRVVGENVVVRGLPLRRLDARLHDVDVDLGRLVLAGELRVRHAGGGEARAVIGAEGLADYLMRQKGLRAASVRVEDGQVTVTGEAQVLGMVVGATLVGTLEVENGGVRLRANALTVRGVTLRGPVVDTLIARVNPILSSRDLGLPLRVSDVRTEPGRIVVVAVP